MSDARFCPSCIRPITVFGDEYICGVCGAAGRISIVRPPELAFQAGGEYDAAKPPGPVDGEIHTYFSLSYANYLVLPRTLLQSMPLTWQAQFVRVVTELDEAFAHIDHPRGYQVITGDPKEFGELTESDLQILRGYGITVQYSDDYDHVIVDGGPCHNEQQERWQRILVPRPNPIPDYDRGRARVEPRLSQRPEVLT